MLQVGLRTYTKSNYVIKHGFTTAFRVTLFYPNVAIDHIWCLCDDTLI